ncbi:MAG: hypothetical protein Q9181_005078 [Wetmoreana brouardii]
MLTELGRTILHRLLFHGENPADARRNRQLRAWAREKEQILRERPTPLPQARIDISQKYLPSLTSAEPTCILLCLPFELRQRIYDFTLGGSNLFLRQSSNRIFIQAALPPSGVDWMPDGPHFSWNKEASDSDSKSWFPGFALLLTCRQVYSEAIDTLYGNNVFYLDNPLTLVYLNDLCLRPQRVRAIRHLALQWMYMSEPLHYANTTNEPYDFQTWQRFWNIADLWSLDKTHEPTVGHGKEAMGISRESCQAFFSPTEERDKRGFNPIAYVLPITSNNMQARRPQVIPVGVSICLRCFLRLSKRNRLPHVRQFHRIPQGSQPAAGTLFQRDYFSGYRAEVYTRPAVPEPGLGLHISPSEVSAWPAVRGQATAPPSDGSVQQSPFHGGSPTTKLPHRRRKRLKAECQSAPASTDVIPPDASSRLSTLSATLPPSSLRRLFSLYLSLSKPRLSFLIVLTTAAAYSLYPTPALLLPQVTESPSLSTLTLVFLTAGTALSSASANALNMLMEPEYDAKMSRTRNRPVVRGYIKKRGALVFATIAGIAGVGSLFYGVNPTVAFLGGLNIFLYAGVYTPLKRLSVLNTWVGAVVGGIPPLMGWAAAAGQTATGNGEWRELLLSEESIGGWLLATFLYAWQFPHFNALSWTIRDEYKHAGYRMLAWVNPRMNGRVAFRYALLSFPICGALWWFGITDRGFLVTSSVVNTWIVREAWKFWRKDGHKGSARSLFWAGVWHLPVVMVLAMAHKKGLWEGVWRRLNGETPEVNMWMDDDEADFEDEDLAQATLRPVASPKDWLPLLYQLHNTGDEVANSHLVTPQHALKREEPTMAHIACSGVHDYSSDGLPKKAARMASTSPKSVSALMRYRPAIVALTALAAGLAFYAIHISKSPTLPLKPSGSSNTPLHRSNAQRLRGSRRRTATVVPESQRNAEPSLATSVDYTRYRHGQRVYGLYQATTSNGIHEIWLAPDQLLTAWQIHQSWGVEMEEASSIRQLMEEHLLDSFFAQEMPPEPPIPLTRSARRDFVHHFAAAGQISAVNTEASIDRYERGDLQSHPSRIVEVYGVEEPRPPQLWSPNSDRLPPGTPGDLTSAFRIFRDMNTAAVQESDTLADTDSERSFEAGRDDENKPPEDQNLMNLLYRIAEDQAKKDGFVHRGVNCNSCNTMPIRGIRYRCTNCHDYDLCEQCEALQVHDKTHLFYKIRIPAPFLGTPRYPTPVWYPGKPGKAARSLTTDLKLTLSQKTGIQDKHVDAHWEQFQCIAASDYPDDPHGFQLAIDRRSFNKCFVPNGTIREPPPNLIYDRMFSFYDTNDDGLIGFEEFLSGISCITYKASDRRRKSFQHRIFQAYDIDNDGFVDRKDFLGIFRAYYAIIKELTKQVVSAMDDEFFDEDDARDVISGSQPLSSIFSGAIPPGQRSLQGVGKRENRNGDLVIDDGQGVLRGSDEEIDLACGPGRVNRNAIVADNAEVAQFGDTNSCWYSLIAAPIKSDVEDDNWPQYSLSSRDVEAALGRLADPEAVKDRIERSLVLCVAKETTQQNIWNREVVRRRAIANRWEARQFYLDGAAMDPPFRENPDTKAASDQDTYLKDDIRAFRIAILDRMKELGSDLQQFREVVNREVRERWPDLVYLSEIADMFETWIRKKCTWSEMAQALAPTRDDIPVAITVVGNLLHFLYAAESIMSVRREVEATDAAGASPNSKRSRSSSKVRFEDEADDDDGQEGRSATSISSRSIPAGERWGGYHIPEPEVDYGREMIYQVTQEGMNELVDPIFKLREDLALEVLKTKWQRRLYEEEISQCMREGFAGKIMTFFEVYQKKWYQGSRETDFSGPSQAEAFVEFIFKALKQLDGSLTHENSTEADQMEGTELQEVTNALSEMSNAIIKLDQSVAHEVHSEAVPSMAERGQTSSDPLLDEDPEPLVPEYARAAIELQQGTAAFGEALISLPGSTHQKPIELLLADAGYGVLTPPVQDFDGSTTSSASSSVITLAKGMQQDHPDPTLPQHRPNDMAEWEAMYGNCQSYPENQNAAPPQQQPTEHQPKTSDREKRPPLPEDDIMKLALWDVIEEDDRKRGGSGRLALSDFELIMNGDKGAGLGFIAQWVEKAAF